MYRICAPFGKQLFIVVTAVISLLYFFPHYSARTAVAQDRKSNSGIIEIFIKISERSLLKDADTDSLFGSGDLNDLNARFNCVESVPVGFRAGNSLLKQGMEGYEGIEGIFLLRLKTEEEAARILTEYVKISGIEYAQENYTYQVDQAQPDPRKGEQWYLSNSNVESAWDSTLGSPDVLIGIIDTGIDYGHEDLGGNIWINPGEDINTNGVFDSSDVNGIDDDGNGFIDDIRGWDFTDAPGLADNADYRDRDNDPYDEMGHGTSVAGIIGAIRGNGKGIAGVAPGCKIMNLRAGTSKGYLQDDDVASAILYAVFMGARVINMSFGDKIYSHVLRDVIRFAYKNGVIIAASKGNNQTDVPHYPSDFPETISIGAIDNNEKLASFSNFGPVMDIVAPGVNLLTTKKSNQYGNFSGTSASAPVVSAVAGLLLSLRPGLGPEEIRSILRKSAVDLGSSGVDSKFGAGKLNAGNAVRISQPIIAHIARADLKQNDFSRIVITGTAAGREFKNYSLSYSLYPDTLMWTVIDSGIVRQVIDDTLAVWNKNSVPAAVLFIRLAAISISGEKYESRALFTGETTSPLVSNFKYRELLRGTGRLLMIEFNTDQNTSAAVFWKSDIGSSAAMSVNSAFVAKSHKFLIPVEPAAGNVEFSVRVLNENGISAIGSPVERTYRFAPSAVEFYPWTLDVEKMELPPLYLLPDFFKTAGETYIAGTIYDSHWSLGEIGFFRDGRESFRLPVTGIPRGTGDFDGDGRTDILIGVGSTGFVFEMGNDPSDFSSLLSVWTSPEEHWAAGAVNIIGDSLPELVFRSDRDYLIYSYSKDNTYVKEFTLPNFTAGSNTPGVPHVETGDFDGDGNIEILMGDTDGDIYLYEFRNGEFVPGWSHRLIQVDAVDFITAGDLDGDGIPEIIAGCHTEASLNEEVNSDAKYWSFDIFRRTGDNSYIAQAGWNFSPFQSLEHFPSGCAAEDIDGDGRDELCISIYPNFYIIGYVPELREYKILWASGPDIKVNNSLISGGEIKPGRGSRFLRFGQSGLVYTSDEGLYRLRRRSGVPGNQLKPVNLSVSISAPSVVRLRWDIPVDRKVTIERKRSDEPDYSVIGATNARHFSDTTAVAGALYSYRIVPENTAFKSSPVTVFMHEPPVLRSAEMLSFGHILLTFSEDMEEYAVNKSAYTILPEGLKISSVEYYNGFKSVLVSLDSETAADGRYTIVADTVLSDRQRAILDPVKNSAQFDIRREEGEFYLVSVEPLDREHIAVTFSESVDGVSARVPSNYSLEPFGSFEEVDISSQDDARIILSLSSNLKLAKGSYTISARNVRSKDGRLIAQALGSSVSFSYEPEEYENVIVYPNPYVESEGEGMVIFENVTYESEIFIMTQTGQVVRKLANTDGGNKIEWHLDSDSGQKIASGIYMYYVKDGDRTVRGKLAVIR